MDPAESSLDQEEPLHVKRGVRRVLALPKDRFRSERPFYALLADSLQAQGLIVEEFTPMRCVFKSYDVLQLHHPESFISARLTFRNVLRFAGFFVLAWMQKLRGCRIVWTAHNEGPHEPGHRFLESVYWKLFPPLIDGVIYLSNASRAIVHARWPGLRARPAYVIPHGDLRGVYVNEMGREEARARLGYDSQSRIVAFVGNIRAYKGVTELVRSFVATPDPRLRLLIAGRVLAIDLKQEILDAIGADDRVRLVDELIKADEMQKYLNAADLVVLPFRHILNSGSAILGLSFDRPILVPDLGSLRELQSVVGDDWIMLYDGALTPSVLVDAIESFVERHRSSRAPLERLCWAEIGRQTAAAYASLSE
jgi:beta-1,4-mannosyltransferase